MCGFKKFHLSLMDFFGVGKIIPSVSSSSFFLLLSSVSFLHCSTADLVLQSQTSPISLKIPVVIFNKFCPFQFHFNAHPSLRLIRYFIFCLHSLNKIAGWPVGEDALASASHFAYPSVLVEVFLPLLLLSSSQ